MMPLNWPIADASTGRMGCGQRRGAAAASGGQSRVV